MGKNNRSPTYDFAWVEARPTPRGCVGGAAIETPATNAIAQFGRCVVGVDGRETAAPSTGMRAVRVHRAAGCVRRAVMLRRKGDVHAVHGQVRRGRGRVSARVAVRVRGDWRREHVRRGHGALVVVCRVVVVRAWLRDGRVPILLLRGGGEVGVRMRL